MALPRTRVTERVHHTHSFRHSDLSLLVGRPAILSPNPSTSSSTHQQSSLYQQELQSHFLTNAITYFRQTQAPFEEVTAWPPVATEPQLELSREAHHAMVAALEVTIPRLTHCMDMLSGEEKAEIEAAVEWQTACHLVLEADKMITVLRCPALVSARQNEHRAAYKEGLRQVEDWKLRRKEVLDMNWGLILDIITGFKAEPKMSIEERAKMANAAQKVYCRALEQTDRERFRLREWENGKLMPEMDDDREDMQELKKMETQIQTHLFALYHCVISNTGTADYGAAWTVSALDALRKIVKDPEMFTLTAIEPTDDKVEALLHKQIEDDEDPIVLAPYQDPAKLACNHVFSFSAIVPWLDEHRSCPMCREPADFDEVQRLIVQRDGEQATAGAGEEKGPGELDDEEKEDHGELNDEGKEGNGELKDD